MLRSLQTSESWPSFVRSRLTPPTRTPSVVESMNVVPLKSTTTSLPPCPITSSSCCLNSGAVYRSTSPVSEMTYASPESCSVLMSKFMRANPPELLDIDPGGPLARESIRAAEAVIVLLVAVRAADLRLRLARRQALLELLDLLLDLLALRRVRVELQDLLPCVERDLRATGVRRHG